MALARLSDEMKGPNAPRRSTACEGWWVSDVVPACACRYGACHGRTCSPAKSAFHNLCLPVVRFFVKALSLMSSTDIRLDGLLSLGRSQTRGNNDSARSSEDAAQGQEKGGVMPNASDNGETRKTRSLFAIKELVEHPATCEDSPRVASHLEVIEFSRSCGSSGWIRTSNPPVNRAVSPRRSVRLCSVC